MSQTDNKSKSDRGLEARVLGEIGTALEPLAMSSETKIRLKDDVLQRIKKNTGNTDSDYLTIRNDQGTWIEIAPGVARKNLHRDSLTEKNAFLLRIQPGCEIPGHPHDSDELCMVVEGDVSLGDIHLQSGDFHLARKGSVHGLVRSNGGAVLFIQAAA